MTLTRALPLAVLAASLVAACVADEPASPDPAACRAEDAARLVGQVDPGEAAIMALTGAGTVRMVGPNQPVTMDYRFDRVTVVKNPANGRILRASCG